MQITPDGFLDFIGVLIITIAIICMAFFIGKPAKEPHVEQVVIHAR